MDETKTSVRTGSVPDGWTMDEEVDGRGMPFRRTDCRIEGNSAVAWGFATRGRVFPRSVCFEGTHRLRAEPEGKAWRRVASSSVGWWNQPHVAFRAVQREGVRMCRSLHHESRVNATKGTKKKEDRH